MSQAEVLDMRHDLFLANLKYAFLHRLNQTQEGRDYIKKAKRLQTTEPDYDRVRSVAGYKREEGEA